jgi:NAD(P)-dependent dehydrogenase (short-subunit alcohol dehydrogenase family)
MGRLLWPRALVVTFVLGLAAGGVFWRGQPARQETAVNRLQQQVNALQARLRARENSPDLQQPGANADASRGSPGAMMRADRFAATAVVDDVTVRDRSAPGGAGPQPQGGSRTDSVSSRPGPSPALAPALTAEQIRANTIVPSWIDTPMTDASLHREAFTGKVLPRAPLRRLGGGDDFGGVAVYLAGDARRCRTGDTFVINGGYAIF